MKSGYGYVTYSNDPYKYSFLNKQDDKLDTLYLKKTSWQHEEEFRFITLGIGSYSNRLQEFSVDIVSEIILGYNISSTDEAEILEIIKAKYPKNVPVFKTRRTEKGELVKALII